VKGESYADVIRRLARRPDIVQSGGPLGGFAASASPRAPDQRLVAAVEQALRARARRHALARRAGFVSAVAAALALAAGVRVWQATDASPVADGTLVIHGPHALTVLAAGDATADNAGAGQTVALKQGMPVGAGLTLRAPASGEVRVGTADGTSLALEAGSELTVTEAGPTRRFALKSGAVSARVSRLFAGERFLVDTRDAEVEVRGTSFRVAVVPADAACGDGSTTRVSVLEGVVRIRAGGREVSVPEGGAWPEGCEAPSARAERNGERAHARVAHAQIGRARAQAETPAPIAEHAPTEAPVAAAAPTPAPVLVPPAPASSLSAENDLFAAAVRAKKQGRPEEAARLFGDLVWSHPASPLVESALVQRMKLLATIDPAAGARAAAAYLERFPSGFARPEAQALAGRAAP
jgi:ferric-dicitrate binding protein FerR (iron transport regulator)